MLLALGGNDAPFALYACLGGLKAASPWRGRCSVATRRQQGSGDGNPCRSQQWLFVLGPGADVTPASCEPPPLCPLPAALAGAAALSKMHFVPVAKKGTKIRVGLGEPGDPAKEPAVAGGHQHLNGGTQKRRDCKRNCFCSSVRPPLCAERLGKAGPCVLPILLWFGPVMPSPRYPHGRDCGDVTAQLSWKLNQTTGSKTLINMLCILRIRLLVTLKLNSNAILKYIIR